MQELGLAKLEVEQRSFMNDEDSIQHYIEVMCRQDIHLYYGNPDPSLLARVKGLRKMKPGRSGPYNEVTYPPTIIWSLDDNYHYVSPLNNAFLYHGTRLSDGTPLIAGDSVDIMVGKHKVTVWKDGQTYNGNEFSVEANRARIALMDQALKSVGGVSLTTPKLENFYRDEIGYPNTYVYPNCIYFPHYDIFRNYRMVRKDPKQVKVMWQGGASHYEDWHSISGPLRTVVKNHPNVFWTIWGSEFKSVHDTIPRSNYEYIPWVDYSAYKMILGVLDFDFVVAPLNDNIFNEGKSAIKMYEAAALPIPKPTLAARVPPYSDEIIDGETGLLYSSPREFVEKFGMLVENPDLRTRLAQNAQAWLHENRDAMKVTPLYYQWLVETREATKKQFSGKLPAEVADEDGNRDHGQDEQQDVSGEGAGAPESGHNGPSADDRAPGGGEVGGDDSGGDA
jgi:glycosyltransferase involved in cell wall biosynthesis